MTNRRVPNLWPMAEAWPATGWSNRPFFIFLQLRPAPAKSWILIERLNKSLLDFFIYFCDADNVFMKSASFSKIINYLNDKHCELRQ